jgi:hypothetical protein
VVLNLAKSDGFLRVIKVHFSGGEVKPSAPWHEILRHVKDPLTYDRY